MQTIIFGGTNDIAIAFVGFLPRDLWHFSSRCWSCFVQSLGYEPAEQVFDPAQNVNLQMCYHPAQPAVEIIWPGPTSGPVNKLNQRNPAGIIYHLCYATNDLAAALDQLAAAGLQPVCISPPTPALLFGGRKVSFYNVLGMGLVEILEPLSPIPGPV